MEVRKAVKTVGIYWLSIGFLPGYIYPGRLRAAKGIYTVSLSVGLAASAQKVTETFEPPSE